MPINYSIDSPNRLVTLTFRGQISYAEFSDHFTHIQEDPHYQDAYDRLIDMGNSQIMMSKSDRECFCYSYAERISQENTHIAIVSTNPIEVANSLIFRSMIKHESRFMVFSTTEAALDWLKKDLTPSDHTYI